MKPLGLALSLLIVGVVTAKAKTLFFEAKDNALCPDKEGSCSDDTTCCLLPNGKYGCCPFPNAVCCSDQEHCCPSGFTCDVSHDRCVKGDGELIDWAAKLQVLPLKNDTNKVVCPDQQSYCEDGQTCCQLVSGQWGCCPHPQAVCCDDHATCCPHGYICDDVAQLCVKQNGKSISKSSNTKAALIGQQVSSSVICPDQQSQCGDGQTCCQLSSGQWGCCPYPQAVCCSDHEHCCPNGYSCDVPHQQCVKGNGESIPWSSKTKAILFKDQVSSSVICPDQQSQCGDGQTCCQLSSGQWGCCPYPQAVCCSDHEHCCPNGYSCDVAHQQCVKGNGDVVAWSSKTRAAPVNPMSNSVVCPDGSSMCSDGQTCCQLASGMWGCCALPRAVCCSDHEHCCPNGYTCDVPGQRCVKENGETLPWSKKLDSIQILQNLESVEKQNEVVCPDKSSCAEGETCCLISASRFGCCPLAEATCCSDYLHCCPHAYTCDVPKQTCIRSDGLEVPWSKKTSSKSAPTKPDLCGDQQSACGSGGSGGLGCCPYKDGVCCSDGLHCCPENTVCDAETQMCQSNKIDLAISWRLLEKTIGSSVVKISVKTNEKCPDQKFECPADTTCCQMQSGLYSCCPFKGAVCCEDKLHCCPSGFTCDVEHSNCVAEKPRVVLPWEMFGRRRAKINL